MTLQNVTVIIPAHNTLSINHIRHQHNNIKYEYLYNHAIKIKIPTIFFVANLKTKIYGK